MQRVNDALKRVPPWLIYVAGALWAGFVFWQAVTGTIGVDPVRELEHELGLRALQLLVLGLAVTPLRRLIGLNLLRFRRAIGVTAFGFAVAHLLAWAVFDVQLDFGRIAADILKRPYITIGMAALLFLLPLAITSNNASIRRLGGASWRKLHRLVYPAGVLAGVHFVMVMKSWPPEPLVYLGLILILLFLRLFLNLRFV